MNIVIWMFLLFMCAALSVYILFSRPKKKTLRYRINYYLKYRIWRDIKNFFYNIQCHIRPSMRYHIIDLRKHAGSCYPKVGWIDKDFAIEFACFHMLCEFVEKEDPKIGLRTIDECCPYKEDKDLLAWWEGRLEREKEVREIYHWWKEYTKKEQISQDDDEVDQMLLRLINIRHILWT